jgi:hypothetical protein
MLGHKANLNKFRKINNPLHDIRSQWHKIRPQQEKKPQRLFKHMGRKQHIAEKLIGKKSKSS